MKEDNILNELFQACFVRPTLPDPLFYIHISVQFEWLRLWGLTEFLLPMLGNGGNSISKMVR